MRITSRTSNEQGIALVTALLAVMLATALMAGMFASLTADQRSHAVDRDQSQAYAAAHAGLEKLTSNLAQLFATDFSPNAGQIDAIDNVPPDIGGFEYTSPDGGSGYAVTYNSDVNGNPAANANADVTTGPFTGFKGLITPYTITVTARSTGGSEVRLRREIQTVAVPVFQFGIFGEKSLSFHAGPNFDFGGRVHTNENLFIAEGTGNTLTFRDKITALGQIVRAELENGNLITNSGHTGTVVVPTVIGSTYRNLASTEGSVSGGPGSSAVAGWKNLSEVTYHVNIRNTMTGAKRLDLPLVSQGAVPVDLIRRPRVGSNENVANGPVYLQRYFAQASLRILLSDRAADITGLPTVTAGAPVQLDGAALDWIATPPFAGYVVGGGMTPLARAIGGGAGTGLPDGTTVIVGAGNNYAAPYHLLNVAAVPQAMKIPNLTINGAGPVTCLGKTHNTFTGCTLGGTVVAGSTITAVTPVGNTVSVQTTLDSAPAGAGVDNRTITVGNNGTIPFAQDFAWINDRTNNVPTPMSCEGYDTNGVQRLTNCRIPGVVNNQTTNGRVVSTHSLAPAGTSLIGGFIKIERQNNVGAWSDVTAEILSLGFAARNQEGTLCEDPTPNAVIRFQRLRDNGGSCAYNGANTPGNGSIDSRDYWPNVLYDARESQARFVAAATAMTMGGIINYVSLDVGNLKRWLNGTIGTTGAQALNNNGFIVYFSDRRGNHDDTQPNQPETAEYGNEDSINQAQGGGSSAPNAVLEPGEDRNENGTLQIYGATPSGAPGVLYGGSAPFDAVTSPLTTLNFRPEARVNRQVLFRRALKLVNGGLNAGVNSLPDSGLTIAAENAVYVQGNYNASATDVTAEPNRPAAIIADVLSILSNGWTDAGSFNSPHDQNNRNALTTGYRFALIAGKSMAFPRPNWAPAGDTGTDGGVHNFMRMLEDWSGQTINYRGSVVSLYTARQFLGIYRADGNVYAPGTRAFNFDTDFLTPSLLPPGTPMFRDINTLKFRQILRPNQ